MRFFTTESGPRGLAEYDFCLSRGVGHPPILADVKCEQPPPSLLGDKLNIKSTQLLAKVNRMFVS